MWFGTADGLNRYDGYKIVVYRSEPKMPGTLPGNKIYALHEDRQQTLWIATDGGLCRLDRKNRQRGKFISYPNRVYSIYEDRKGRLWFGGISKYLQYNNLTRGFTPHSYFLIKSHRPKGEPSILTFFESSSNEFWIGTSNDGLCHLQSLENDSIHIEHFLRDRANPNSLSDNAVWAIVEDKDAALWLGTFKRGICKLVRDRDGKAQIICYRHDPKNPKSLSYNRFGAMLLDRHGTLWIGTDGGGLNRYVRETDSFVHFKADPQKKHSLSDDRILSLYQDRSGIIWVGTKSGGVNKFDPGKMSFQHTQLVGQVGQISPQNIIWSIYEDKAGVLWVGSSGTLTKISRALNGELAFASYPIKPDTNVPTRPYQVRSILEDRDGTLWLGILGAGLAKFDQVSGTFTYYRHDPGNANTLVSDNV
ncbi:MAG: hypothetical protein D6814_01080, partial [Calditrichaeota bacterium]